MYLQPGGISFYAGMAWTYWTVVRVGPVPVLGATKYVRRGIHIGIRRGI